MDAKSMLHHFKIMKADFDDIYMDNKIEEV